MRNRRDCVRTRDSWLLQLQVKFHSSRYLIKIYLRGKKITYETSSFTAVFGHCGIFLHELSWKNSVHVIKQRLVNKKTECPLPKLVIGCWFCCCKKKWRRRRADVIIRGSCHKIDEGRKLRGHWSWKRKMTGGNAHTRFPFPSLLGAGDRKENGRKCYGPIEQQVRSMLSFFSSTKKKK